MRIKSSAGKVQKEKMELDLGTTFFIPSIQYLIAVLSIIPHLLQLRRTRGNYLQSITLLRCTVDTGSAHVQQHVPQQCNVLEEFLITHTHRLFYYLIQ